jgi:hypothetical protein
MKMRRWIEVAGVVAVAACGSTREIVAPITRDQLCSQAQLLIANEGAYPTIDDDFEVIARLLPGGFGGLTTTSVNFVHPEMADTARATARTLMTCTDHLNPYLGYVFTASVRKGDYDWVQLRGWYRTLFASAPAKWISADMDESRDRLAFAFTNTADLEEFKAAAIRLGVPEAALVLFLGTPGVPLD